MKLGHDDHWDFYTDKAGRFRWRRIASNGEIVGASTQGYKHRAYCMENALRNGYLHPLTV